MTFARLTIVSAAALMGVALPAQAGFQFTPPPAQQQQAQVQQAPTLPSAPADMPMPIVPAPDVEAMALSPMPGEVASQPQKPASADGGLSINPYPLQGSGATHGVNNAVSLDQAMIEGTGNLRPVVTPGSDSGHGRIARAAITSRFDGNPSLPPHKPAPQHFDYSVSSITPLPGGDGASLQQPQQPPVIQAQPLMPRPAPTLPQQANPTQSQYTEAVGFGRDLPLALALTQVVPPDYSFSFSPAIDAGTTVSWQGGKPWNVVLNEMLSVHGLSAVISGRQVTIQSAT